MATGRKEIMLNSKYPTVYNNSEKEALWKQGYVLFARLKNHMIVFTKARKEKMDTLSNVKIVAVSKDVNITRNVLKSVLQSMKDGLNAILKKSWQIKELIITGTKNKFLRSLKSQEKRMDMQIQKPIGKGIQRKLIATDLSVSLLNSARLSNQIIAKDVKTIVRHTLIIMIMTSLWKSFGYVEDVMEKSIEQNFQRERLSPETSKEDAIVQTTEETCREESEAVLPPRNWSVIQPWMKVIEWLRHTAGCSFYQGQAITNDLWLQNLRSTGI